MNRKKIKTFLAFCLAATITSGVMPVNYLNSTAIVQAAVGGTYEDFGYEINGSTASIVSYSGTNAEIEIPDVITVGSNSYKVIEIKSKAFQNNTNVKKVSVPASVTSIGDHAFYGCNALEEINLPDTLTSIDTYAFAYCKSLKKFSFPKSMNTIKESTLEACQSLTYVDIPEGIQSIENYAIGACIQLKSVNIPKTVSNLDKGAFLHCSSLESINIDENNTKYRSVDGVVYDKALKTILRCPGGKTDEFKILDGTTSIGDAAFSNCYKITGIQIPDTVSSIGASAFINCKKLKTITIPKGVSKFLTNTFYGCDCLETIIFPNRTNYLEPSGWEDYYVVKLSGNNYNETQLVKKGSYINTEHDNAIYNVNVNGQYTTKVIPTSNASYSVEKQSIGDIEYIINKTEGYAGYVSNASISPKDPQGEISFDNINYYSAINLDENNIKNTVLYIKYPTGKVSKGTIDLSSLKIDNTMPSIDVESDTAGECTSLNIIIHKTNGISGAKVTVSKDGGEEIAVDSDKYNVTQNGTYKFTITSGSGLTSSKSISISNITNEEKDDDYTFALDNNNKTASLTKYNGSDSEIKIPDTIVENGITYKVTSIGMKAFKGCSSIVSVEVPDSIKTIESYAFYSCKNLKNIKLPEDITKIDNYTFANCVSLEEIIIPSSVSGIGNFAFSSCAALKRIRIPSSINSIGNEAFYKCTNLNRIDFDNSNLTIGKYGFKKCDNLVNVVLRNSGNYDILKDKGLNLDDYYKVILKDDTYTEVQLVKKGGNKLIFENDESYYNLYDGDTLVTDYTINEDKNYRIVRKYVTENDYKLEGTKGEGLWYGSDVYIKAQDENSKVSEDGVNWYESLCVSETLKEDKCIYIKDNLGVISKGKISKDLIKIDKEAPSIEVTGDLTTKMSSVDLSIVTKAGESGVYKVTVSKDGGVEEEVKGDTYEVTNNGKYLFKVTSGSGLTSSTEVNVTNVSLEDFKFEFNDDNNTAKITDYLGSDEDVILPSKVKINNKEYTVNEIDDTVFDGNLNIVKVTIPDSYTFIGDCAFNGCENLKDVILSDSLEIIGEMAFSGCINLENIVIPDTVQMIDPMAFSDCTSLKTITLPLSLISMEEGIFEGCDSIENIIIKDVSKDDISDISIVDINDYYKVTLTCDSYEEVQLIKKDKGSLIYDSSKYKLCDKDGNEVTNLIIDGDKEFKLKAL